MRWLLAMLFWWPSVAFAQLPPTCEDQLAISNQVLQDTTQDRWRLQVELGSQKVRVEKVTKELEAVKATIKAAEKKATPEPKK